MAEGKYGQFPMKGIKNNTYMVFCGVWYISPVWLVLLVGAHCGEARKGRHGDFKMRTVISASRRTDIPGFYMRWFEARIKQGSVVVPNPVWKGESHEVSLRKEDVHSIVLWSKNFRPFLDSEIAKSRDYNWYFNFSIVDCPDWEPGVLPLEERLDQLREIGERWSPRHINWRFDPIVFWDGGKRNNLDSFLRIGDCCQELGITRCTFSFVVWYNKVKNRLRPSGLDWWDPPVEQKRDIVGWMVDCARERSIRLESCCNDDLLQVQGVRQGRCVDGTLLTELFGERCTWARDRSQRKACGCTKSADIGSYAMTCPHGCLYCYANPEVK